MKTLTIALCLVSFCLSAHAGEAPTAKVECYGLATVGAPIDPGFSMANHASTEFDIKADVSAINPCNAQSGCFLHGATSITFKSAPTFRIEMKVTGRQDSPNDPAKISGISARLIQGNKVVAVSETYGDAVNLINPEPYQILMDMGKRDIGLYQAYNERYLKGDLLDSASVRCSVSK